MDLSPRRVLYRTVTKSSVERVCLIFVVYFVGPKGSVGFWFIWKERKSKRFLKVWIVCFLGMVSVQWFNLRKVEFFSTNQLQLSRRKLRDQRSGTSLSSSSSKGSISQVLTGMHCSVESSTIFVDCNCFATVAHCFDKSWMIWRVPETTMGF